VPLSTIARVLGAPRAQSPESTRSCS
jgi:hypothetical protein